MYDIRAKQSFGMTVSKTSISVLIMIHCSTRTQSEYLTIRTIVDAGIIIYSYIKSLTLSKTGTDLTNYDRWRSIDAFSWLNSPTKGKKRDIMFSSAGKHHKGLHKWVRKIS